MRYAHVLDGIVENVSIWSTVAPAQDDDGRDLVACEEGDIGWSYDGQVFTPPEFVPDPDDIPGVL